MPHRRHVGSRRKFKDGEYRLLSSVRESELDRALAVSKRFAKSGEKIRYIRGKDYLYHIYHKVADEQEAR